MCAASITALLAGATVEKEGIRAAVFLVCTPSHGEHK